MGKTPPDIIDVPEHDFPLVAPPPYTMSKQEVDSLRSQTEIDNRKKNQQFARWIVVGLISGIGLSYIFSLLYGAFTKSEVKFPTEVLSLLQAALFTLLGYLFGDKSSNGKAE